MKKLSTLLLTMFIALSCVKEHSKSYVSIAGKIENNKDSILTIYGKTSVPKTILINEDGSFKDTLSVINGALHTLLINPQKRVPVYLKNGYNLDINVNSDAEEFIASYKIYGKGSSNTNFIIAQIEKSKKLGNPQLILNLEKEAFDKKLTSLKKEYDSILNSFSNIDSSLVAMANMQTQQMVSYFKNSYTKNSTMGKGNPSPKFNNYVDYKGGKKSLDSYKGKYVYIDVWATWCGPCIREIPSLKKLENEYHSKNIEFVSISTDEARRNGNSWEAAEKKWRDFVKTKQMTGVQLWSGEDFSFQQAYQITGIPRFILIDPKGNIVEANAPRPSDPRLKTLFTSLGI
jgi:thiol-disulfide isomerase/thioredoxin